MDNIRVWVRSRESKRRCKTTYSLRWICSRTGRWRSKEVGTDRKIADREAAKLEEEIARGTHKDLRRVGWDEFVSEHVATIDGNSNRQEAERTLNEFGGHCNPRRPAYVRFGHIESFVGSLKSKGNSVATINKKLRYLRAAFNKAVRRDYIARNPMFGWQWTREEEKEPRIASSDEEVAILTSADHLYGLQMVSFIIVAINTGARRGELSGLQWPSIDLDSGRIHFTRTKAKRERTVFVDAHVAGMLRRLRVKTLQDAGPFTTLADNLGRAWGRVIREAGVSGLSIHDLRRTYITRQIRAGVPLPTVQKLVGHANITTTIRYYNLVDEEDLKKAVVQSRKFAAR